MPQEFQVVRCVNCEKFQVDQTKKSKKWICKVCGEKQSYLHIYFTGSARECRSIVQEHNFIAGEKRTAKILAESPNFFPSDSCPSEELNDEYSCDYHASKKLKSEVERSVSTEEFQSDSTYLFGDENSFFDECSEKSECYHQSGITEEFVAKHLDSVQKHPLATSIANYVELHPSIAPATCNKNDSSLNQEMPKVKPRFAKNRGFQKILKAAEKLS